MNLDPIVYAPNGGLIAQGDATSAIQAATRFDVIVFCAEEFQPDPSLVLKQNARGRVIHAPNDDATLTREQLRIAQQAAQDVALAYARGRRILVTCMAGRNRSGLVTALALCLLYGIPGQKAVEIVRKRRAGAAALTNPDFVRILEKIQGQPTWTKEVMQARMGR